MGWRDCPAWPVTHHAATAVSAVHQAAVHAASVEGAVGREVEESREASRLESERIGDPDGMAELSLPRSRVGMTGLRAEG